MKALVLLVYLEVSIVPLWSQVKSHVQSSKLYLYYPHIPKDVLMVVNGYGEFGNITEIKELTFGQNPLPVECNVPGNISERSPRKISSHAHK